MNKLISKTPLNNWHKENGGRMINFFGWDMPLNYDSGILKEHILTRKYGALFDISHMARILVSGKDKFLFLQKVLSYDIETLKKGDSHYSFIINKKGEILDDIMVYRKDNDFLIVVNAANYTKILSHFIKISENYNDVIILDKTEKIAMFSLQGPFCESIIKLLVEENNCFKLNKNCFSNFIIKDTDIIISRTGYTGEPIGYELFVPSREAEKIWLTILEKGKSKGIIFAGLGARDSLRLEAKLPLFGNEFGKNKEGDLIPLCSMPTSKYAISFNQKKKFIGKKSLFLQFQKHNESLKKSSKNKKIVAILLIDEGIIRKGNNIYYKNNKVGFLTSAAVAPYINFVKYGEDKIKPLDEIKRRVIGFAFVNSECDSGDILEVEVRKKFLKAIIVKKHGTSKIAPYFRAIIP